MCNTLKILIIMVKNFEFKFLDQTDCNMSENICEKFNDVNTNDLLKFTLDYVFNLNFFKGGNFDWNSYLSTEKTFNCDIYYQNVNIGNIQLCDYKGKFFNVTYNKNVEHSPYLDEYDPMDKYYLVSQFKNGNCSYKFETSYNHPRRERKGCPPRNPPLYFTPFSWSFNGVVKSGKSLNYLFISEEEHSDDEINSDCDSEGKFEGYLLKNADFEDAVKSLLLFHLLVNNLIGDYDLTYFEKTYPHNNWGTMQMMENPLSDGSN